MKPFATLLYTASKIDELAFKMEIDHLQKMSSGTPCTLSLLSGSALPSCTSHGITQYHLWYALCLRDANALSTGALNVKYYVTREAEKGDHEEHVKARRMNTDWR